MQHYYAHGKLLLTGEYFVLDGALALAVPTRWGQHLRVKELSSEDGILYWVALDHLKKPWLNLAFDIRDFICHDDKSQEAATLSQILSAARILNPSFLAGNKSIAVETFLEFPNEWGLGSSATLINTISQWAEIDGIALLGATMGGSGYDVACGSSDTAIVYQLRDGAARWEQVAFEPPFASQLYFVYTGQKQLSNSGIRHYRENVKLKAETIIWLNQLTESMLACESIEKMTQIIEEHECYVAESLSLPMVKQTLFADYWGAAKSLGAWGGDYALLTNVRSESELYQYLDEKGLGVRFRWDEMIWAA